MSMFIKESLLRRERQKVRRAFMRIVLSAFFVTGVLVSTVRAEEALVTVGQVIPLSVLDFDCGVGCDEVFSSALSQETGAILSKHSSLLFVDANDLKAIVPPDMPITSGSIDSNLAVSLGKATGVSIFVLGRVFRVDQQKSVVLKILSAETGWVYGEVVSIPDSASAQQLAQTVSSRVTATIEGNRSSLIPPPRTIEGVKKQLQALIGADKAERVSIALNGKEGTNGAELASTPLRSILEALKFRVETSGDSTAASDVAILGRVETGEVPAKPGQSAIRATITLAGNDRTAGSILFNERRSVIVSAALPGEARERAIEEAMLDLAKTTLPRLVQARLVHRLNEFR